MLQFPLLLVAQDTTKITIDPVIRAASMEPIPEATVTSDQDGFETMSDGEGQVHLEVTSGAYLVVEAAGYETRILPANAAMEEIVLYPYLDGDAVQVAFQTQSRDDLIGGVSAVNMRSVLDENYIISPLDGMGAYVGGFHGNMWGNDSYLTLVDGVPRDLGSVMPTEIAQMTFLKGINAIALYGSRGAKGVLLITTKRGVANVQTVDVRTNFGVHVPKSYPKYLGSGEYMTLFNEGRVNDGLSPLYSQEEIYNHASGINPYRYPNVNYFSDEYLQPAYARYDATMEISGGNKRARYYTNMGYWGEGSVLDFGQAAFNGSERFNIRGNVDISINEYLSANVDAAAIFYNGRGINADFWAGTTTLRPNRFTPLVPVDMLSPDDQVAMGYLQSSQHLIDGRFLLGGTQLDQNNPIAGSYAGGSNKFTSRQFQFNAGVNADLRNIIEGLSFNTFFGLDNSSSYNLSFTNDYAVYQPSWTNFNGRDEIASLTRFGQDASSRTQNIGDSWFRQTLSFSSQLNYEKAIDNKHHISTMLIASGFQVGESAIYHKVSNANIGLYAAYDYKSKYYLNFSGALVHSAMLAPENRQAFSPTASLGWRLSEEKFLTSSSVVDDLKLSVSGGILHTDLDIAEYYLYEGIYTDEGSWYEWRDGLNNTATDVRRGQNYDLSLPKREEISIELNGSLFNNTLTFNGSYFVSEMTGLFLQDNNIYPSYFETGWPISSWIPYVNYNNDLRTGFDFQLNLNQRIKDIDWNLGFSGIYYDTRATKRSENFEFDYQTRVGMPLDGIWGLQTDGFFTGVEDIANSNEQAFGEVRPGDIKYVDQNGDGIINAQDEVYLGRGGWSGAPLTMGIHLSARYKNFTFFALGTSRTGAFAMKNSTYFWAKADDKYSEEVRGRWTEATADAATYPRLTTLSGANNYRNSDFWLYSTNRFDLTRVQLSYSFPRTMFGGRFLEGLDVYANGANLLTISPNRDILEMNIGAAPQTRFYNVGLKAKF
ncbi:SusC/RagA family TonB-linked outer membrane protein [Cyclobacterium lianum]|nr:SusC/RagA family TonB-linked outer membrane protein [Cyclobacterium lianum]